MNWKLNYWTLLFVIAAAGLAYTRFSQPAHDAVVTPIVSCPADSIPNYGGKAAVDSFLNLGINNPKVKNRDVHSFTLPRCELREMLETKSADSLVTAELALSTITNDSLLVHLYFRIKSKYDGKTLYFDFSRPCPPMCRQKSENQ